MRSDGPRRRVVCLTVVERAAHGHRPDVEISRRSGELAQDRILDRQLVVLSVIPARELGALQLFAFRDRRPEATSRSTAS